MLLNRSLALTAVVFLLSATPAYAHNILVSAQPATDSRINTSPKSVSVTFDKPVQFGFTELIVVGPGGTRWEAGPPAINGDTVSAPLRALGPAGTYTVEYQIVSTDGHPVHGESRFTLTVSGSGIPAGYSAGSSPPPPAAEMPVWPWIVGAGALLLLGLALARRLAGRTKSVPARGAD